MGVLAGADHAGGDLASHERAGGVTLGAAQHIAQQIMSLLMDFSPPHACFHLLQPSPRPAAAAAAATSVGVAPQDAP